MNPWPVVAEIVVDPETARANVCRLPFGRFRGKKEKKKKEQKRREEKRNPVV